MLADYLRGYIDALCYPIYRGARNAGCVEVPKDQVTQALARIQRIGCVAVIGPKRQDDTVEVWAVRSRAIQDELEQLFRMKPEQREAYHRGIGQLLGYSEQHIRMFLETERPTV